jgi:ribonuclease HI
VGTEAATGLTEVELWTDGACSGNPGPGGWAALLRLSEHERVLSGGEHRTTNNRMEVTGVVQGAQPSLSRAGAHGLQLRPKRVRERLDARWQRNGWTSTEKQPVKNRELWEELVAEVARHEIEWVKVKGHYGVELNEHVDRLACAERDRHAQRARVG